MSVWHLYILVFNFLVIDLKTQLSYFKKVSKILSQELGDAETTTLLAKAVYLINIGSNDYLVSLTENSSVFTAEKYVDMVVGNLTTVIKVYIRGYLKVCLDKPIQKHF